MTHCGALWLLQERGYSAHGAYSLSKLCNILFSMELGHRLRAASSPVTSNALDPGTVNTKMLYAGWGPIGMRLEDANDEFFVSTISELDGVTNEYFVGGRSRRAPAPAYDAKARRKLWDVLCDMTGAVWDI